MAPFSGEPSNAHQVALALAPKCAAFLSLMGSGYILFDVFRIQRTKPNGSFHCFHRLLIGLSIGDMLLSIGFLLSTWPMPVDTPFVWGAAGNTQTCALVGFMEQAGVSAVLYNGSLSINYLLKIRYGWSYSRIQRSAEVWLHIVPVVFGLSTMVAGLPLKLYNSGIFDCWIAPYPQGCEQSWQHGGETTCIRGDNATLYQWLFDLIPKYSAIVLVTINMWLIYCSVARVERRSFDSSVFRGNGRKQRLARRLATQSALYVGALYLTYTPVIITRITELALGYVYYEMLLTISITIPLQGFWNAVVYLRPRWIRAREQSARRRWNALHIFSQVLREGADDEDFDDNDEDGGNGASRTSPLELCNASNLEEEVDIIAGVSTSSAGLMASIQTQGKSAVSGKETSSVEM